MNIQHELENIEETLLLPLWGRAVESRKENPRLMDKRAIEIIGKLDYDFTSFKEKINIISQLSWIARCIHIDNTIREFTKKYPRATIVNIGCGLDTTSERITSKNITFYNLDLPNVIILRKKLFGPHEQGKSIASSFLDHDWMETIRGNDGLLFIAAGVLYFFDEMQIKNFFVTLANRFTSSELIFDAASPLGIKIANRKVLKESGINERTLLQWGLKTGKICEKWDKRITLLYEYPLFKDFKKGYPFGLKTGLWLSDVLKLLSMIHLRIGNCA